MKSRTIPTREAEEGKTYLSAWSLAPVTYKGRDGAHHLLTVEVNGKKIRVNGDYELMGFNPSRLDRVTATAMRAYNPGRAKTLLGDGPEETPKPAPRVLDPKNKTDRDYVEEHQDSIPIEALQDHNPQPVADAPQLAPEASRKATAPRKTAKASKGPKKETLASCIDSLLKAGGLTVKEIAIAAGETAKAKGIDIAGKDINANVRARLIGYRRRGIARLLMERAIEHGRESGCVAISLETATDNTAAKPLYEALGFVRDEGLDHYALRLSGP